MFTPKLLCKVQINSWNLIQWRCLYESHYDILKLKSNCSNKEIRSAFIKLTKECHPDKHQGTDMHNKYVRILEAYTVLKNPDSRADYDLGLCVPERSTNNPSRPYRTYTYDDSVKRTWSHSSFHQNTYSNRSNFNRPASKELIYSVGVVLVGVMVIYFTTIWKFFNHNMVQVDADTARNFALLREIRAQSEGKDNEQRAAEVMNRLKPAD